MDDSKLPFRFAPDPELQNLRPLPLPLPANGSPVQRIVNQASVFPAQQYRTPPSQAQESSGEKLVRHDSRDDFPTLASSSSTPVSAVGQQWTPPPRAQQKTSSHPRSWKSEDHSMHKDSSGPLRGDSEEVSTRGKNRSVAGNEKQPVRRPFDLNQDDFPSLGSSSSSSMRKPRRSLRQ